MNRVAPYAAAASAALILWHAARDKPGAMVSTPAPLEYPAATAGPPPAAPAAWVAQADSPPASQQAGVATIQVIVGKNDTMDAIFRRMALDKSDLAAIRNLPGIRQSLDFLKPGDAIQVSHLNDGEIRELSRRVSETQTLHVVRQDDGFTAKLISNPVQTRIRTATATMDSSLFQAAEVAGISDVVALKLANVFAWDIDFVLDIRAGDRFTVVYEQIYQDGRLLHDGEVLAAEFVNAGKVYRAVRYTADDGTVGYYTPDGKPMRKAFLRAPVEFTRVSSGFNPARLHPILNLIRGHMGTDYAAPIGTPVHAAGDGKICFEGPRGGYGNAIVIAHSNGIQTLYGHMSRFARNIGVGSRVHQGEVIGYVGMTGLATGPHLHYEYLMNGVHMNPQTVHLAGAEPLPPDSMAKFSSSAASLLVTLAAMPTGTGSVPTRSDGADVAAAPAAAQREPAASSGSAAAPPTGAGGATAAPAAAQREPAASSRSAAAPPTGAGSGATAASATAQRQPAASTGG